MSAEEGIEKIEKVSNVSKKALTPPVEEVEPDKGKFDQMMQGSTAQQQQPQQLPSEKVAETKPIEEVGHTAHVERVTHKTPTELIAQTEALVHRIENVKATLADPNLNIKSSVRGTLRSKLTHIDESLQVALSKVGVEGVAAPAPTGNPIERFLGLLSHGQNQLKRLSTEIEGIQATGKTISPATMLAMQMKVNFIQQELEFFTSALSKALESTKTLMNVQV